MKKTVIALILIALAIGSAGLLVWQRDSEPPLPPDMEPASDVRTAVRGKSANDISKITIEIIWPSPDPIVVTKKKDIEALLVGLQEAVRTKVRYADAGPRVGVHWKNGDKPSYFFICLRGPKQAFGKKFTEAYNRVVQEKEYKIVTKNDSNSK